MFREPITLDAFEDLATRRRTSLLIDNQRPVPNDLVDRLCQLVFAAPNHKRTVPWQVAVFVGDARGRLGEAFRGDLVEAQPDTAQAKLEKCRTKYLRAPVVVLLGSCPEDDPVRHRENQASVAAGVENLLLGATAAGLASFWSSPPVADAPRTCVFAEFPQGTELLAVVYLGWPSSPPPSPPRATAQIRWFGDADADPSA